MLWGLTLAFGLMLSLPTEIFNAQILLMWLNLSFFPAFASTWLSELLMTENTISCWLGKSSVHLSPDEGKIKF